MSGDGSVYVNFHGMEQAATDMEQALAKLRASIESLNTNVGGSLADWEGNARTAYQVAQAKWDTAVNRMHDILGNAITTLQNITNDHKLTEHANTMHWENLTA
ncbi:WXG100 family type VII secretion target [Catenulispora sp. NF23]|uniref:ESAT-6-like protein n=1 Tax=Catenulispora pinistramenti TaxID=2705254 RepID=A0ABS5KJN3_9ACTN|nr:WXG100 family type VII secretion target [Catenulispora pinistramenti]MBS2540039.1 WXG100 family type VII secretion target [Catenulispora pinistramenti]MBS2545241.1 WXG100 family type VII secretion target [Catenulispora pinistramenti]